MTEIMYQSATGVARFDFQISACAHAQGVVLNLGSNEDPARLRERFGSRIVNCDLSAYDHGMHRPNVVDEVFDMCDIPWSFGDDYADLVVFGDVLEHMPPSKIIACMTEGRRVAREMCVTVPEDHRVDEEAAAQAWKPGEYNPHTTIVTEDLLRVCLAQSGWTPYIWLGAPWGTEPPMLGWCVMAHRTVS